VKAVFFRQHGGPEVLEFGELPDPQLMSGAVLVRLRAAALNRMDVMVRIGWPGLKLQLPHINGADGAGDVAALGSGVSGYNLGDRVAINANLGCGECEACLSGHDNLCVRWHLLGETVHGTYAQYLRIPARQLYRLPAGFDYHAAAAAALVYQTAWHSMVTRGGVRAGEAVAIVGASGGINTASIRLAKHLGAKVIVVGSGPAKLARAAALGAEVLIDRSKEPDWSRAVYLATGKRGADVVVDNVGTTFPHSLRALRKGGRLLTVGTSGGPRFEIDNRFVFARHLSILGSSMSTRAEFAEVMNLVVQGKLQPIVDSTFPLQDAAAAQERLWRGECFGKITLDIP
jgi:NADPH:quinone reductase-like Zn-dependent oxidoreductase